MRPVRHMCQEVMLSKGTNTDGKVSWEKHEVDLTQAKRYTTVMLRLEKLMG